MTLEGKFGKWEATLTFPSTDVTTGVLDIKNSADSVNTGSGMKDGELKSKDFFDVKENPYITFHSNKIVETGPTTLDVQETFTTRACRRPGNSPSLLPARAPAPARSQGQWPSTGTSLR